MHTVYGIRSMVKVLSGNPTFVYLFNRRQLTTTPKKGGMIVALKGTYLSHHPLRSRHRGH